MGLPRGSTDERLTAPSLMAKMLLPDSPGGSEFRAHLALIEGDRDEQ